MKNVGTICIIDDDSVYQFTTQRFIEYKKLAQKVITFKNGRDAINHLKAGDSELPDVILLDINMPIMNGWEFLTEFEKIKTNLSKFIKIFMVSSSIDHRDLAKAKDNKDVFDYLTKPIDDKKLDLISKF